MKKLSLLTFTRNHVDRVFSLIDDLYDTMDDIVLIDSSDKAEREKLYAMKKRKRWAKLKIFYMVPLGFVEIYRPYGLKKCKNDWVLYLDVDERISEGLKDDIGRIINSKDCSAFNLRRYEDVDKAKTDFFTFQIRLFRKSKTRYKGIIDERPIVKGRTCYLEQNEYYIEHRLQLMRHSENEYYKPINIFMKYELMSYAEFNRKMLLYLSRVRGKAENTRLGRALYRMLIAYEKIASKKGTDELSTFDYFLHAYIKHLGFAVKAKDWRGSFRALSSDIKYWKQMHIWKKDSDHDESYAISKVINRDGFVKFLKLDDEKEIQKINKKYMDKKPVGLSLLVLLLKKRYNKRI